MAEAQRFAPSLNFRNYAQVERRLALADLSGGNVVVASYALAQINEEEFNKISWSTLVLDEALALKNSATKRAKSVATLPAACRLALSGTPVENRLADPWSNMNTLNPGLLGSAQRFSDRYAHAIERSSDDNARFAARSRLRRLVAHFWKPRASAPSIALKALTATRRKRHSRAVKATSSSSA